MSGDGSHATTGSAYVKQFFDPAHGDSGPREKIDVLVSKIQRLSTQSSSSGVKERNTDEQQKKIHYWRAKMFLKVAKLYTEKAWVQQKKPRKFFLLFRGFDVTSSKETLVEYKKNYLQLSLSSIERALDLQQHATNEYYYYECVKLKAHILCTLSACDAYSERRRCEQALECLLLLNELEEIEKEKGEETETKKMIMHIAHAVAEKKGSWENLVRLEKRFEEDYESERKEAAAKEEVEEEENSVAKAYEYRDDYSNYFNELEYDRDDDREALERIIDSIVIR